MFGSGQHCDTEHIATFDASEGRYSTLQSRPGCTSRLILKILARQSVAAWSAWSLCLDRAAGVEEVAGGEGRFERVGGREL